MAENNFDSDELRNLADKADAFTRALKGANQQEEAEKQQRAKTLQGYADLVKSLGSAGKAALSAEESQYKYAESIKQATNGASNVLSQFGAFGKGLGLIVELMGEAAASVLKYNDAIVRTNKTLGQTGQNLGLTSEKIIKLANQAGYTSKTIDRWTGVLSKYSGSTLYFGKTASEGTKYLSELIDVSQTQRSEFYKLGYSVDGFNETLLGYADLTANYNSDKTSKNLQKEALDYVESLSVLSAYTGDSIDVIKSRQQEAKAELAWQNKLASLDAKTRQKYIMLGDILGKGGREWLSGGGFASKEAKQEFLKTGGEMSSMVATFESDLNVESFMKAYGKSIQTTSSALGSQTLRMTKAADVFGLNAQLMAKIDRFDKASMDAASQEVKDKRSRKDDALDTNNEMIASELNVQQANDKITQTLSGPVNSGFTTFMNLVNAVADKFTDITLSVGKALGKTFGGETVKVKQSFTKEKIEAFLSSGLSELDIQRSTGKSSDELRQWVKTAKSGDILTSTIETSAELAKDTQYGIGETYFSGGTKTGIVGDILNYIGKKEANGNYNIMVGGKTNPNLTNMTVAEVLKFQSSMKANGHESTAVGKYQIIQGTLSGLVKKGYASLNDKFDPKTQDNLAEGLMKDSGLDSYLGGKMSTDVFADKLSMVWASLPYHTDRSYYAGVGSNKSLGSRKDFISLLSGNNKSITSPAPASEPSAPSGPAVVSGPNTGYPTKVASGNTAVVPTNNKGITIKRADGSSSNSNARMVESMMTVFDDIISGLERRASNQRELLKYARN